MNSGRAFWPKNIFWIVAAEINGPCTVILQKEQTDKWTQDRHVGWKRDTKIITSNLKWPNDRLFSLITIVSRSLSIEKIWPNLKPSRLEIFQNGFLLNFSQKIEKTILLICSLRESAPESSSSSGDRAYPGKRNEESWFPLKRFGERKSLGAEKSLKSRRLGDWTRFLTVSKTPFSPGLHPFPPPPPAGTFPVGKLGPCKNGWWTAERGWWGGKGGARPGDGLLYLKWKMGHRTALHVSHSGKTF